MKPESYWLKLRLNTVNMVCFNFVPQTVYNILWVIINARKLRRTTRTTTVCFVITRKVHDLPDIVFRVITASIMFWTWQWKLSVMWCWNGQMYDKGWAVSRVTCCSVVLVVGEMTKLLCLVVIVRVLLDAEDVSVEMSNLQLELSSFVDLDATATMADRYLAY